MNKNYKKIGIVAIAIALVVGLFFVFRSTGEEFSEQINTSLSEDESVVYPDSSTTSTLYFIAELEGVSVEDLKMEFEFDQEVSYEVFYENVKERSSLPIEYYLSAETDFDFDDSESFSQYTSIRKIQEEYEENEVYEQYIKDYKDAKEYRQYKKGVSMYMFELKVSNVSNDTTLKNVKFLTEDENGETNLVYEKNTNVKYVKTSINNNFTTNFNKYETAKYYDGKIKFNFDMKCNQDLALNNFGVQGYDVISSNVYKNDVLMENPSCSTNEVVNIELEVETGNNKPFTSSLAISFDNAGSTLMIYTPQIFAPDNLMLLSDSDYDKYSRYLEYKYNVK